MQISLKAFSKELCEPTFDYPFCLIPCIILIGVTKNPFYHFNDSIKTISSNEMLFHTAADCVYVYVCLCVFIHTYVRTHTYIEGGREMPNRGLHHISIIHVSPLTSKGTTLLTPGSDKASCAMPLRF